ncbi:MAG: sialidase, partial [Gemmatimonadota bacterium]
IAQSNPNRVYAQIETGDGVPYKGQPTDNGELWRSEDGGSTWKVVSFDRNLSCRQAYYTRMAISTDNPDEVYFQCATFSRTMDGGVTNRGAGGGGGGGAGGGAAGPAAGPPFTSPGGDHHDMWIDPTNPNRMINGNDQNVAISTTRSRTWLRTNLPIAQMYHVTTDTRIPYYVYGNRQDGPSYRGPSNSRSGGGFGGGGGGGFGSTLPRSEWHGVYGGESGMATPDPVDTNIIWSTASGSGARGGIVVRMDARSRHSQQVEVWPFSTGGHPAANLKYRFIWNAPFLISPHDHNRVYTASQHVHQSTDGGRTWREISPDLTRNDKSKQGFSGGLTGDNIGVEYGGTLMAIAESRVRRGVMWSGSNDGQVHVTRDTARTWTNVSAGLQLTGAAAWGSIKSIAASRWDAATAYLTVEGHQEGDFGIWVFRTRDYGKTWDKITNGINPAVPGWANIIIEDPVRRGLLYLGTENALYVSYNEGDNWVRFNNNLPPAPVYGLTVQEHFNDLVVATYGRGFFILDDISPFQQLTPSVLAAEAHLFMPRASYRFVQIAGNYDRGDDMSAGQNPVYGATINYWAKTAAPAKIEILDSTRRAVRTMTQNAAVGVNRIHWNFQGDTSRSARLMTKPEYDDAFEMGPDGTRPGFGSLSVLMPPGRYSVRLTLNGVTQTQPLEVRKDPHGRVSIAEINAQFRALLAIQRDHAQAAEMTETIEKVRSQIQAMRGSAAPDIRAAGDALEAKFKEVEGRILDLRITGRGQDGVRWPVRLAGQLQYVSQTIATSEYAPTASQREVAGVLAKETRDVAAALGALLSKDLADHNAMLRARGLKTIEGAALIP